MRARVSATLSSTKSVLLLMLWLLPTGDSTGVSLHLTDIPRAFVTSKDSFDPDSELDPERDEEWELSSDFMAEDKATTLIFFEGIFCFAGKFGSNNGDLANKLGFLDSVLVLSGAFSTTSDGDSVFDNKLFLLGKLLWVLRNDGLDSQSSISEFLISATGLFSRDWSARENKFWSSERTPLAGAGLGIPLPAVWALGLPFSEEPLLIAFELYTIGSLFLIRSYQTSFHCLSCKMCWLCFVAWLKPLSLFSVLWWSQQSCPHFPVWMHALAC